MLNLFGIYLLQNYPQIPRQYNCFTSSMLTLNEHSEFDACNMFQTSWDRDNKDWEGCGNVQKKTPLWNNLTGKQVIVSWLSVKKTVSKSSAVHKQGWGEVHHVVKYMNVYRI